MDQSAPTAKYELHAFAKGADGSLRPFDLVVLDPERHAEFGWQCRVECAVLRERPMRVFGDDAEFAWAMAIGLIKRLVEDAEWSLVDEAGNAVVLPQVTET